MAGAGSGMNWLKNIKTPPEVRRGVLDENASMADMQVGLITLKRMAVCPLDAVALTYYMSLRSLRKIWQKA